MTDKSIDAFSDYDGLCSRDDFARLKTDEEAVYHEFKFRAILMAALEREVLDKTGDLFDLQRIVAEQAIEIRKLKNSNTQNATPSVASVTDPTSGSTNQIINPPCSRLPRATPALSETSSQRTIRTAKIDGPKPWNVDPAVDKVDFEIFYRHLMNKLEEWHNPNRMEKAQDEYDALNMESASDDYVDFKNKFVRLAGKVRKPKSEWINEFHRKLPTTFVTAMMPAFLAPDAMFESVAKYGQSIALNFAHARRRKEAKQKDKEPAARRIEKPRRGGSLHLEPRSQ
ncbi:hypothetical protein B0T26DRAFT_671373 [Lasiosphaeria miniovina]|uniref:Uncharacterized protein n=1 Tax=Lasiosphaeria miniovina TaxID=1954250 RepID=A0AA40ECQ9_9PEZI|nr:uncharacterized protein B0T26DRAFT_671373 [Lasiosphaeria miniovina]KAK0735200.1 hypothetical protein B0T26DRAFT_671373 [Lasiosphaeria miniovina]